MKDPFEETATVKTPNGARLVLVAIIAGMVLLATSSKAGFGVVLLFLMVIITVILHEAGHYLVARRAGMKVTEFFVGFGPRIWSFRRGETEYGVKAIILGGYVRIVGMNNLEEVDEADEPRTFRQAPFRWRLATVLAGITMNVILCFVLFTTVFAVQGIDYVSPKIGVITTPNSQLPKSQQDATLPTTIPSRTAGLKAGDEIVAIDDLNLSRYPETAWTRMTDYWTKRSGQALTFHVLRHGTPTTVVVTPLSKVNPATGQPTGVGFVGVSPTLGYQSVNPLQAAGHSISTMGQAVTETGAAFGRFFSPSGVEHQVSTVAGNGSANPLKNERPVSIVGILDLGGNIFQNGGFLSLLFMIGYVNFMLAFLNVLPLMFLDGGYAAVATYEKIASVTRHKKVMVDARKLFPLYALTAVLIGFISLTSVFLDIKNKLGG